MATLEAPPRARGPLRRKQQLKARGYPPAQALRVERGLTARQLALVGISVGYSRIEGGHRPITPDVRQRSLRAPDVGRELAAVVFLERPAAGRAA